MAGHGPAPKENSRTRHKPLRGTWKPAPGSGWQHGPVPPPPEGLLPATVAVWHTWMTSWYAAHWTPEYLPQITTAIRLFDEVERGRFPQVTELRQWMDGIGVTWKGQQDRRWQPPKAEQPAAQPDAAPTSRYAHLRAIG